MQTKKQSELEFITLMALLMAMVALAIDALLPALQFIGQALGVTNTNDNQLLITMIFLGLGFGQLVFGPLSDSFGRKIMVYIGFIIFILASFICVAATSLEMMIIGRILQGIGLSSPRTISIAMIRDSYDGDQMAKIMSFITSIFILVPTIAPALGKYFLDHYSWEAIFYVHLIIVVIVCIWFGIRQKETLTETTKIPFKLKNFKDGLLEIFKHKSAVIYTLISALITGSFMVYLSASQQIFEQQYGLAEEFPYLFAGLALVIGAATFLNGNLVLRLGMEKLATSTLFIFTAIALVYVIVFFNNQNPNLIVLLSFLVIMFFFLGFVFGNLRALTMQPLGHIAGIGSAITGFISTLLAVPIATFIGGFVDQTALPLFIGFLSCGLLAIILYLFLKKIQVTAYSEQ